jgi:O-antigen/teichoic acid export membrane protein
MFSFDGQSAKPLMAELDDLKDRGRLNSLYQTTTKWSVMISLPFILIVMLFPAQILSIFGKSFVDGAAVLMILAFVNLINVGTGMCGALIDMTGRTKLKLANSSVKVGLSIFLNFLLIPRYGILGAAISALIYEFISNVLPLLPIWFLYRILPYDRGLLKPIAAGLLMLTAWLITNRFFPPGSNLLLVFLNMLLLLAVYAVSILVMGLSPEEQAVLARFRRRLGLASH